MRIGNTIREILYAVAVVPELHILKPDEVETEVATITNLFYKWVANLSPVFLQARLSIIARGVNFETIFTDGKNPVFWGDFKNRKKCVVSTILLEVSKMYRFKKRAYSSSYLNIPPADHYHKHGEVIIHLLTMLCDIEIDALYLLLEELYYNEEYDCIKNVVRFAMKLHNVNESDFTAMTKLPYRDTVLNF